MARVFLRESPERDKGVVGAFGYFHAFPWGNSYSSSEAGFI